MRLRLAILFCCSLTLAEFSPVLADENTASIYLIGNSLTWDTIPSRLDGDVQWHVDCGKSLPWMHKNPQQPCVKSSQLWPTALKEKQYDIVTVQPHYGSTLDEDVETISKWLALQPDAVFVIHSGWAHHAKRELEYANEDGSGTMQHSPAYFAALLAELKKRHPKRQFRQTQAFELLARIAADIEQGQAPIKDVAELHRDAIHMQHDSGKYLMHNAMRHALGQPRSSKGFEKIDPQMKAYLDSVLDRLE